jgi:hypothetical protein
MYKPIAYNLRFLHDSGLSGGSLFTLRRLLIAGDRLGLKTNMLIRK